MLAQTHMTPTSLYLHIPFCASKCAYCDFNSIVGGADLQALYLDALTEEIARTGSFYNEPGRLDNLRGQPRDRRRREPLGHARAWLQPAQPWCSVLG